MPLYTERFFDKRQGLALRSARGLVPVVVDLLRPKSVVDVGCARGEWLSVYRELGVQDVTGVDGDYVDLEQLLIDRQSFHAQDLAEGVHLGRTFDLAMSLEVAEHLPAEAADRFVASLVKLAPIVLFSAAIPFQGGSGHLNEQWQSDWAVRFARHDYHAIDAIRPRIWKDSSIRMSYRQNTLLYVHRDTLDTRSDLRALADRTRPELLDVVLPDLYLKKSDPSTRRLLRKLRRRLGRDIRSMIGLGEPR